MPHRQDRELAFSVASRSLTAGQPVLRAEREVSAASALRDNTQVAPGRNIQRVARREDLLALQARVLLVDAPDSEGAPDSEVPGRVVLDRGPAALVPAAQLRLQPRRRAPSVRLLRRAAAAAVSSIRRPKKAR